MLITDEQLKQLILKTGLLNEQGFASIATYAKSSGAPLTDSLIEKDILSDENLGIIVADHLKIPFVALAKLTIPEDIFRIIPEKIARKYQVIPFAKDNKGLKVAMADPTARQILEMVAKKTGLTIYAHLATERDIYNTLKIYRKDLQKSFDTTVLQLQKAGTLDTEAPIEKIVDQIINYAYQDKTSDIHIEPEEKDSLIRFRIDGILHDMLTLPRSLHDQVLTRIKVLSKLRTDEHLSPQDGKMRIKLDEEDLDIRVSILPLAGGEKVVMRLLASKFRQFSLLDLGMNEPDLKKVTAGFSKSYGMILSTGPTGSGKTTSIYAILKILNVREKNITTIEDPVEYQIKGVNQINVNPKTNLTFAAGLRSILRQDPNIIFVGEIRDSETAGIAVNAALTGHLVLSTLHTNDAATALPRLTEMGVEPFLVASTVNVIVAQRLVRKICDMCKTSFNISATELSQNVPLLMIEKAFGKQVQLRVYKGEGCKVCNRTGYNGRVGLFEVLQVDEDIRKLINKKEDADVIIKTAVKNGMATMMDDGLLKIAKGETTIEEVLRVTKVEVL